MLPTIACHLCALVGARNGAKPSTDPPEAARRKGPEKGPRPNNLNVSVIEIGGSICEGPIGPLVPPLAMTCRYGTCARVKWAAFPASSVRGTIDVPAERRYRATPRAIPGPFGSLRSGSGPIWPGGARARRCQPIQHLRRALEP